MLTNEQFDLRLKPHIKRISLYLGCFQPITLECQYHGKFTINAANDAIRKNKPSGCCRKCHYENISKYNSKSHDNHVKEVQKIHGNSISVIGIYTHSQVEIKYKCEICNYTWNQLPYIFLKKGTKCSNCYLKSITLSQEEYEDKVANSINNDIKVLGAYVNTLTKIEHKCSCGNIWLIAPSKVLQRKVRCPKCYTTSDWFKNKSYKLGNRIVNIQGFEPYALDKLLLEGANPLSLVVNDYNIIPIIHYVHKEKSCKHYPDIYNTETGTIYEVKSFYTLGGKIESWFDKNRDKAKYAINYYKYDYKVLLVYSLDEIYVLPKYWFRKTLEDFTIWLSKKRKRWKKLNL